MGLIFDVVAEGDDVEAFAAGLVNADGGPDLAVGKDGVGVEVADEGLEARDIGEIRLGGTGIVGERQSGKNQHHRKAYCLHRYLLNAKLKIKN